MKNTPIPEDIVPLVSYSVRKNGSCHGRDYKLLLRAMDSGQLLKITVGKKIFISKSAADRIIASSNVALCKAKSEPSSRCGVSMEDRVRALEHMLTDLCMELGFTRRS